MGARRRRAPAPGGAVPLVAARLLVVLAALAGTLVLSSAEAYAATPVQGDAIVNVARLTWAEAPFPVDSAPAVVTAVIPAVATIELLQHAPLAAASRPEAVVLGAYRTGPAASDPMAPQGPPRLVVASGPLDLSAPLPLAPAPLFHQADPVFVRVTDADRNLGRNVRDTLLVTLTDDLTGDAETILLTEDGPDTGVFVGYVQTVGAPPSAGAPRLADGILEVAESSRITARYADPADPADAVAASGLVDPAGLVFDSATGRPVSGATVTVLDASTGAPASVVGDDGTSTFPSSVVSGGTVTDGGGRVYAFAPGAYRFPFLARGTYRLEVKAPAGYRAPSTVPTPVLQALPGAPFTIVDGSRGERFALEVGPAIRVDVPLDPGGTGLWVAKAAGRERAGIGDQVPYQLDVTNSDAASAAPGVQVVDVLPVGFRYQGGSTRVGGVPAPDPAVSPDGRTLTFSVGTLGASQTVSVRYLTHVGAGARPGTRAVNAATARSAAGQTSNTARATVRIADDFFSARTLVLGRVTTGACDERDGVGTEAVPGARVLLEDGTHVLTDRQGLFHLEGLKPGSHVVQLDLDSLPEGWEAVPCTRNDRFAGRTFSQFVDLQGGTAWRADFHVRPVAPPKVPAQVPAPPPPGPPKAEPAPSPERRLSLTLRLQVESTSALVEATIRGAAPASEGLRAEVVLPEGLAFVPGSAALQGGPIADPRIDGRVLHFVVGTEGSEWTRIVTLRANVTLGAPAGTKRVEGIAKLAEGSGAVVAASTSGVAVEIVRESEITLRPQFATLSADLGPGDLDQLRKVARSIERRRAIRIVVVGHTDSQRISGPGRLKFADNEALSLARARSVAATLAAETGLPLESFTVEGRGASLPVATNQTANGRALNRRVEVTMVIPNAEADAILRWIEPGEEPASAPAAHAAATPAGASAGALVPAAAAAGAPVTTRAAATPTPTPTSPPGADPSTSTSGAASPSAPVAAAAAPRPPPDGLVSPRDGDLLPDRVTAVQARVASYLTPRLEVDGREVPAERIGYKRADPQTGQSSYTYVGVEFRDKGPHSLVLSGIDPFGNARFKESATVIRVGDVAAIRLVSADGNVADGKTPVRMRFEVLDPSGNPIRGATRLQLREGSLRPYRAEGLPVAAADPDGDRAVAMDKDGWVSFQPVSAAGPYRAVVAAGNASVDAETWVAPRMHEWVLVGLAEGTAGHDLVKGNVEALPPGTKDELWTDGRVALYAKGQIQGKWLATLALDTSRTRGEPVPGRSSLFQVIDPNEYYTLYGDGTQQGYDAPSARKLYLRLERDQFYALFGDFDTGLTATELSRYTRRMNGVKAELQARVVELNLFGTRTDLVYARDELPGDGTSGLYRLSSGAITLNSEAVTLVARDRFRSELVVSARTLTRFVDYSIDYDSGTIFFREPIPSRDERFNPITIVVEYETPVLGWEDYTVGGRAGVKLLGQRLRAGVTAVHEGLGDRRRDLVGVDGKLRLLPQTQLRAEGALTERTAAGGVSETAQAWLAEVQHQGRTFDGRVQLRELERGFGLGQQPLSEAGTRKLSVDTALRLGDRYGATAQAYRQEFFANDSVRTVGEVRGTYTQGPASATLGLLEAGDELADGSTHASGQVVASGKLLTFRDRLTLGLDYAQSAWGNGNADYPTRVAGRAEYKLRPDVALVAAQELTFGAHADTQDTRVGLRATPWKGASLTTSTERQLRESDERVIAAIGLRQTWQVTEAWKLDASGERSASVRRTSVDQLRPGVPPASGAAEDFTAVAGGASYQVAQLLWDGRAELRTATSEDKWGVFTGLVAELTASWGLSGRARLFATDGTGGAHGRRLDLRFGAVYRPAATRWILLDRLDGIVERRASGAGVAAFPVAGGTLADTDSWRVVNNFTANHRPRKDVQLSVGWGAKFVRERIEGTIDEGFSDQRSAEARLDLTSHWDVGVRASALQTWTTHAVAYSAGPSVGFSPVPNAWISVGVNVLGYRDRDFSAAEYTAVGPYLKLRFKFDQESVREAARWVNRQ